MHGAFGIPNIDEEKLETIYYDNGDSQSSSVSHNLRRRG